jgi:hypothetical protein
MRECVTESTGDWVEDRGVEGSDCTPDKAKFSIPAALKEKSQPGAMDHAEILAAGLSID